MIADLTQWIMNMIEAHGPISVFVGVIIESIIVPIPSPLIIMGAGTLLVSPDLPLTAALGEIVMNIVIPGAIASTMGAWFAYGIAWYGGKPVIDRFSRFLGFDWDNILKMEKRFQGKRAGWTIFLLRALPIMPLSLISGVAGVLRLPIGMFSGWTFLGSIPRCLLLGYLGWSLRDAYHAWATRVDLMETVVSGGIVVAVTAFVIWLRLRLRREPAA